MKLIITSILYCLTIQITICQTKAFTENGDTVYIYNNGTWSFEPLDSAPIIDDMGLGLQLKIDTILSSFKSSSSNKKQVSNSSSQFILRYNDEVWKRVPPATLNEDAEFAFQAKTFDAWCIVITEETPFPKDNLLKIAKNQMEQNLQSPVTVRKVEIRSVNDYEILRGVLEADFGGAPIVFDTYYFSDDKGSVQLTSYASKSIWNKHKEEIQQLLNGFIVTD